MTFVNIVALYIDPEVVGNGIKYVMGLPQFLLKPLVQMYRLIYHVIRLCIARPENMEEFDCFK